MGGFTYPNKVLSCGVNVIIQYLTANQPDTLLTGKEIKKANAGKMERISRGGKKVRNPEYRSNTLQNEEEVCKDIAKTLWKDATFQTALSKVELKSSDKEINTEKDLLTMMLEKANGKTTSNFNTYLTNKLRNKVHSIPIVEAQKNEDNGLGPFQDCDEDETKEMKERIIAMLRGPTTSKPVMSENEANAVLVELLEQYSLAHIFHLTTKQMTAIILEYVKEENPHRKDELEREIMEYREENPGGLHDQEYNELACHIDYIIKAKCSVTQTVPLLMSGEAIPLKLYDDNFGKRMLGIYTMATPFDMDKCEYSNELVYEICQGQCYKLLGNYRAFAGHSKELDPTRYMVDIYSARLFDLKSTHAIEYASGEVAGGHGVPLNGSILRELAYTPNKQEEGRLDVTLANPNNDENDYKFTLHRLVMIVANGKGISIFADGALEGVDVHPPVGSTYDNIITYRPLTSRNEKTSILRALRVGSAHSKQSDGDHRMGKDLRYLNGLPFCALTSHYMNTCFGKARKNAGHWCCGTLIMEYNGGVESAAHFYVIPAVDEITFPSVEDVRAGRTFDDDSLPVRDPMQVLPHLNSWIEDVDCLCSWTIENYKRRCDVCQANGFAADDISNSPKKITRKRKSSSISSLDAALEVVPINTRSGRVSRPPSK